MNLRQLDAFLAVMRNGSVTNAASELHVSQPAVSRLIAALEESLGLNLFRRAGNRIQPTPEASILFREAQRAFSGLEEIRRSALALKNVEAGHLRIASVPAYTTHFVSAAMGRFSARFPMVNLSLTTGTSETVARWVASRICDVGVVRGKQPSEGLVHEALASLDGICVFAPGHPLEKKKVIAPDDLNGHDYVSYVADTGLRRNIEGVLAESNIRRRILLQTPYMTDLYELVSHGLGVAIANPFTAAHQLGTTLRARRFVPSVRFDCFILRPPNEELSLAAQGFLAELRVIRDQVMQKLRSLGLATNGQRRPRRVARTAGHDAGR
jgi:DNA-binding transcriptional LysR family regulator